MPCTLAGGVRARGLAVGWERSVCKAFDAAEGAVSRGVVEAVAARAMIVFFIWGVGASSHLVFECLRTISPAVPCFSVGGELRHVEDPDYGLGPLVRGFDSGEVDGGGECLESPVLGYVGHADTVTTE